MTAVLLALRFLLELCLLATFAVVGWTSFDNVAARIAAAVLLPVVVAVVWGVLLSPRRRLDLPLPIRVAAELLLFGAAAVGLWAIGLTGLALGLAAAEVIVLIGLFVRGQPPGSDAGLR